MVIMPKIRHKFNKQVLDSTLTEHRVSHPKSSYPHPVIVWLMNAFRSLPTNEDLRQTYYWESRRQCAIQVQHYESNRRKSRLDRLWKAQWYSSVCFLRHGNKPSDTHWEQGFAMIQGRRFLWWKSVHDLDAAEEPCGRIWLRGHAGVATPSPLDAKWIAREDLLMVLSIFGRGDEGQVRLTLLMPSLTDRTQFEDAIEAAIHHKSD
jgi:hypothetical protein